MLNDTCRLFALAFLPTLTRCQSQTADSTLTEQPLLRSADTFVVELPEDSTESKASRADYGG
jgi:hypothetical protein